MPSRPDLSILLKVTQCIGHTLVNARPCQLCRGDREMGLAISLQRQSGHVPRIHLVHEQSVKKPPPEKGILRGWKSPME